MSTPAKQGADNPLGGGVDSLLARAALAVDGGCGYRLGKASPEHLAALADRGAHGIYYHGLFNLSHPSLPSKRTRFPDKDHGYVWISHSCHSVAPPSLTPGSQASRQAAVDRDHDAGHVRCRP